MQGKYWRTKFEANNCNLEICRFKDQKLNINVIGNGTIRKLGYGLLFAFNSNYGSFCIICLVKRDTKNRDFSQNPLHSTPPLRGPIGILPSRSVWDKRMVGLADGAKTMTICVTVLTQYGRVTDRRTDGRTDGQTDSWTHGHLATA